MPSERLTVETQQAVRHWYAASQSIVELTVPSARANQKEHPGAGFAAPGARRPPGALEGFPGGRQNA